MAVQDSTALDRRLNELKRIHDEVRVQMHLARAEARDEWEKAEAKGNDLQDRITELPQETGNVVAKSRDAARTLMEELSDAYTRIRGLE